MKTLFISDLHLDDSRPDTTAQLIQLLQTEARKAAALYILGDLFEYWLGDDTPGKCGQQVAAALADLNARGVACFFMHGNRDFLLGEDYAQSAGLTLLPQPFVIDLYGEPVLLLHGDSLCTDDVEYQQFRKRVRDPAWQAEFLAKPTQERRQLALQARAGSTRHMDHSDEDIMDVNQAEVVAEFVRHGVSKMIHGHTHRPTTQTFSINGTVAHRYVLGDWYRQMSVLRVQAGCYQLSP